nr:MAG TPA: hypothetical protein [Caudoviricetes sp.]
MVKEKPRQQRRCRGFSANEKTNKINFMKKNLLSAKLFQFLLNGKFCFRDSYIVSDCLVLRHVVLQQFFNNYKTLARF